MHSQLKRRMWMRRRSRSSQSLQLQLADWLQCQPTRGLRSWTRNGQTGSTGLKHCYWQRLWTSHNRNRPLVRSRWSQLTHHQLMSSGRNPSSEQPTNQLLSLLTDPLDLLIDLLYLQLPTRRLLGLSRTDLNL